MSINPGRPCVQLASLRPGSINIPEVRFTCERDADEISDEVLDNSSNMSGLNKTVTDIKGVASSAARKVSDNPTINSEVASQIMDEGDNTSVTTKDEMDVDADDLSLRLKLQEGSSLGAGGSLPGSRKVSFMNDGNPSHKHPVYPGLQIAPKLSTGFYYGEHPPSRKTSMEAFYYPAAYSGHQLRVPRFSAHGAAHGKVSVFSLGNASDAGSIQPDEFESMPCVDHYRISVYDNQRPTLYQLRESEKLAAPLSPTSAQSELFADELYDDPEADKDTKTDVKSAGLKFGWIQGVLIRCLLSIFGVMLFLRLSWITGQAGIGLTTVIIVLSSTVTGITTMSMSAICTNGEVKGGGAYYMISRSLGPEFGGSIGVVFSLANAIAAAMYIVGFAETVRDLIWENGAYITGDPIHEVRIIGIATCCLCLAIVLIGMEWEAKAQLVLLLLLTMAIINYIIGSFIPSSDDKKWKGVVGYSEATFTENFGPGFTAGQGFFGVFSIFFPAATGVLAGANISGDLKDPQTAIPKGTFLAIAITTATYIVMAWVAGACAVRNAVGTVTSAVYFDVTANATKWLTPTIDIVQDCGRFNQTCTSGLLNDNGMVGIISAWRPLILAGIFAATLSSALASLVGAPKVFQALAKDRLFPYIHVFGVGHGASGEPRRGYFLCFFISLAMICVGSLDIIAPIISNFFLMAYALINFSCFDASVANSPGFRPSYKYYSKWISLLGSLVCIAVMFLINWWAALVTFLIVAGLYSYVKVKKPDVNWGSSTQANAYRDALKTSLKLVGIDDHVKNYRPQILVLSGYPRNRANLVDFASAITKKQSLLVCGHVFQGELEQHVAQLRSMSAYRWFKQRKVKAFYNNVCAPTFRIGVQVLMQALGVGKLRPNTLLLGYKTDWKKADPQDVLDYFNVLQLHTGSRDLKQCEPVTEGNVMNGQYKRADAFDLRYSVGILRVAGGFDRNKVPDDLIATDDLALYESDNDDIDLEDTPVDNKGNNNPEVSPGRQRKSAVNGHELPLRRLNTLDETMENQAYIVDETPREKPPLHSTISGGACLFQEKQYGTIDVWWLYDDGGLALLVPYILSQRKIWKNCKLRVFCMSSKKEGDVTEDQMRMATLLTKFRINYSELTVLTEMSKKPQLSTYREFENMIHQWRLKPGEFPTDYAWKISDADLVENKHKTYRHLRIREKLREHSKDASLIVMTLPVPRKTLCPAGLYMGWLEILTAGMPPMLLLRGNQESVLTYYS